MTIAPASADGIAGAGSVIFSRTKTIPASISTRQRSSGAKAGALRASPVLRSKQA